MKVVSLFAGIGGFDLALTKLGHQIVYANEWDQFASKIYEKHFAKPDTRDIRTVPTSDIPDHDLLVGGFPCQAFSVAGKRRGFDDTRGTLFFDIARILKDKRPRYFLLENVKGLLSHEHGETFSTILETLTSLGYIVQWRVCNSREFGVPQNRERVIIVGSARNQPTPEIFSFRSYGEEDVAIQGSGDQTANAVVATYGRNQRDGQYISRYPLKFAGRNQKKIDGDYSFTIDGANTGGLAVIDLKAGGSKTRRGTVSHKDEAKTLDQQCAQGVALYDIAYPSRVRKYTEASPTIRDFGSGGNKMPIVNALRKLTPIECERLQGFPDNWTEGISDTQRYKCLGNAVTVNVIYHVAKGFSSIPATIEVEKNIEPPKQEEMKPGGRYRYQREYPYICAGCGRKRYTRKYDRRSEELCTKCERAVPDENQVPLFDLSTPTLKGEQQ